MQCEQPAADK